MEKLISLICCKEEHHILACPLHGVSCVGKIVRLLTVYFCIWRSLLFFGLNVWEKVGCWDYPQCRYSLLAFGGWQGSKGSVRFKVLATFFVIWLEQLEGFIRISFIIWTAFWIELSSWLLFANCLIVNVKITNLSWLIYVGRMFSVKVARIFFFSFVLLLIFEHFSSSTDIMYVFFYYK